MYGFGAQFAEVRVDGGHRRDAGAAAVGVFDAGRVINPQDRPLAVDRRHDPGPLDGAHEHSVVDPRFGHVVNHDFAGYHIAANADVLAIEAHWLDEEDPYTNPMGAKGIGEVCIVGTAAAIANAVYHATGVRVRDLPITLDKLLQ